MALERKSVMNALMYLSIQVHFKLEYLPGDVDTKEVTAEVIGPSEKVECRLQLSNNGGRGSFIPTEIGMHKVLE
jgi:filamin